MYRYGGELREKVVLEQTEKKPITLKVLADSIPNYHWYLRLGTQREAVNYS